MAVQDFENSLNDHQNSERYVLRLFVTGITPKSQKAIQNLRKILNEYEGEFDLEIIDIYLHPEETKNDQIIAAPTLIKELPIPVRKFIGDMSNTEKIIVGLNLKKKKDKE
jgi:circadian clock protein KaiB